MNRAEIEEKRKKELEIRDLFNKREQVNACKAKLQIGREDAHHEFDLYEKGKVIGGISTSPWKCRTGSANCGGQDRVSTELLWLTLWEGCERRVMVLSDREMAQKLFQRWRGCPFPHRIEIIHCNLSEKSFENIGVLSK